MYQVVEEQEENEVGRFPRASRMSEDDEKEQGHHGESTRSCICKCKEPVERSINVSLDNSGLKEKVSSYIRYYYLARLIEWLPESR